MPKVQTVEMYKTSDGELFSDIEKAEDHEYELIYDRFENTFDYLMKILKEEFNSDTLNKINFINAAERLIYTFSTEPNMLFEIKQLELILSQDSLLAISKRNRAARKYIKN